MSDDKRYPVLVSHSEVTTASFTEGMVMTTGYVQVQPFGAWEFDAAYEIVGGEACWTIRVRPRGEPFDSLGELLVACRNREDLHDELCDMLACHIKAHKSTHGHKARLLGMDWDALNAFNPPSPAVGDGKGEG